MIITLSGAAGSGKSTIAQMLADKLAWPRYYMGGLRRETARKKGMTLADYNKLGEEDESTDKEVDYYQKDLGLKEDNFIIEGRTSWYFIPHSLKIYLDVSLEEGARRIFSSLQEDNNRNEADGLDTLKKVEESMIERKESDRKRYQKYYNIDVYNKDHYDFYLDTTDMSRNEVFETIYEYVLSSLDNDKK